MKQIKLSPVEAGLLRELLKDSIHSLQTIADNAGAFRGVPYYKNKAYYDTKIAGLSGILQKLKE